MFRAQVPADVDLEDRLLYGLTPQRLAILAACVLVAAALARHGAGGWALALPVAASGAAFAWLRPRGRPLDAWAVSAALFALRNFRLEIDWERVDLDRIRQILQRRRPSRPRLAVLQSRR